MHPVAALGSGDGRAVYGVRALCDVLLCRRDSAAWKPGTVRRSGGGGGGRTTVGRLAARFLWEAVEREEAKRPSGCTSVTVFVPRTVAREPTGKRGKKCWGGSFFPLFVWHLEIEEELKRWEKEGRKEGWLLRPERAEELVGCKGGCYVSCSPSSPSLRICSGFLHLSSRFGCPH